MGGGEGVKNYQKEGRVEKICLCSITPAGPRNQVQDLLCGSCTPLSFLFVEIESSGDCAINVYGDSLARF